MSKANPLRLWSGTVFGATFQERLDAALAGGFGSVSMFPIDYRQARDSGLSDADMRALMEERGVEVAVLDPYCQWVPRWEPPAGMSEADLAFMNFPERAFLEAAVALGVESVSVIEVFGQTFPVEQLTERFASFCDRAAQEGLRVHLEFMPFSGVPDLATAWRIVRDAGRANGGLVFDVWHYYRGNPDDALLAALPGEKIYVVQVSDAPSKAENDLLAESSHRRLLPGEGAVDLGRILRTLHEIGGLSSVGAEVFSDDLMADGPLSAGRRAGERLRTVLGDVGLEP